MSELDNLTLLDRLEHYPETISLFSLEILVNREGDRGRNARIAPLAFLELDRREQARKKKGRKP